ncbi:MAG TPA: acyl-CoA dehydrogenase family protein [Solirubrobacteraceae bacterium]|nr:acyl-CoA dehydrogenase family protein [Solirubrobacteraceae bacterium]
MSDPAACGRVPAAHAPPEGGAHAPRPTPPFTIEHERLRTEMRAFVARRLRPHADEWEAARWFPNDAFRWVADAGYLGLGLTDPVAAAVWVEELARCGSGGVAAGLGAHSGIALPPIARFGTAEQKARYVEPGRRGELIAALAITEPGAGSDVAGIRTQARRVDDGYVVNGSKTFITGGVRADILVTAVKTTQDGGHHGLSFLIIENNPAHPGVSSTPLRKLGWHASDTAEIAFDDVFVPGENLLGTEHQGFYLIMANFQWERLLMALGAVGAMQACLEQTLEFLRGRDDLRSQQAIRHRIAEIALELETGRAVTYAALRRLVAGEDAVREVTIAKLRTQRAAFDVIDACVQIHGLDAPAELERALCDARLGPIGGGTDEIMREILGRSMGL